MQVAWFLHDRLGMLEECQRRYGDVFTVRFPWQTLVLVADPALVREIFTGDPEVLHAGRGNEVLRPLLGSSSLLLLDGAEHLRQRRLLLPPFHGQRMRAYGDLIRDLTLEAIAGWPRDRPFSLLADMQEITLSVILRAVFGLHDGPLYDDLRRRLRDLVERITRSLVALLPILQFELGGITPYGRLVRRLREIDALLLQEIERRGAAGDDGGLGDVLGMLLQAVDEDGRPMTPRELRDELMTLLLAGHETSATTLAWCFYHILAHPPVLERIRSELRGVYGEGPVTADRLNDLVFLDAAIEEVSRLQPILMFVSRFLQAPIRLGQWRLPKGVSVAPCIYLVQRRPDLYPEPTRFRPERFLDGKPNPYGWFPFGGGNRRCIGMAFALYEIKVVLATVLSRVDLALPPDSHVRPVARTITLAPSDGTRVVVRRA